MRPVALSIAGSDSGGGAGVQRDLQTMHALGAFGTCALTAVTAQNLGEVASVQGVAPALVRAQIATVRRGFAVAAAKTGMLWSADIVEAVAAALHGAAMPLVVDPVFVASSGAALLQNGALAAYHQALFPLATLVTPNLHEAALLLERPIDESDLPAAAAALASQLGASVLLKGGHAAGPPVDVLWHAGRPVVWQHRRIEGICTHGTGCMLSAAITAGLAQGKALVEACGLAVDAVQRALHNPWQLQGLPPLLGQP